MTSRFILPFADVGSGITPADGALLYFCVFGSSGVTTLQDTWADQAKNVLNSNPVVADENGLFPDIWIDGVYKVVLQDKNNVQQWSTGSSGAVTSTGGDTSFSSPYFVWSSVSSVTVSSGSTISISGIDASALQIMISFYSLGINSSTGGIALQVGNPTIITSNYFGFSEKTVLGGTVSTIDWNSAFSASSPSVGANASTNKIIDYTSSSAGCGGIIMLRRAYAGSSVWYVTSQSEQVSASSALSNINATGVISSGGNISVIKLLTNSNSNTFTSGTILVSQYANTGSITGSNQGPYSNQYSCTGTNDYALAIRGGQVAPTSWKDGMTGNFTPSNANSSTTVTINPNSIGAKTAVTNDGSTAPPINWLRADTSYQWTYSLSLNKVIIDYPVLKQPIVRGGTNANTAYGALDNLTVKGTDIASAATTNIGAATGRNVTVTGTTTITAFDNVAAGIERVVKFSGILTLTYSAAILLPGGKDITTLAGDHGTFVSLGSGNWECTDYLSYVPLNAATGYLIVQDHQTSGTSAGTFTSGSWITRVLNTTVINTITGASLTSNQITLPAGTYQIEATAPAGKVLANQLRIERISGASLATISGTSNWCDSTYGSATPTNLTGYFILTGNCTFELQHRCANTDLDDGLGVAGSFGDVEVYASVKVVKVA